MPLDGVLILSALVFFWSGVHQISESYFVGGVIFLALGVLCVLAEYYFFKHYEYDRYRRLRRRTWIQRSLH
jgi:uncharacterized membrane protein YbhN (UPF0104 family)